MENKVCERLMNMLYIQFVAPDGLEYRIYHDHIEVSVGIGVWENIGKTWEIKKQKSEEKKMNKFKVGDIVRVKPIEELGEINPPLSDGIKKMASTNNEIASVFPYSNNEGEAKAAYFLKGHEGYYFNDSMLEERAYSKDDIFNINVIVPDKVVEIEFYDSKEKMVCHEDDVFDLRKCCFIAIAKHLYKKEYTQEGIEYMATQLTYQKKYVKIVDKALRGYWKKEEEKEKRIREERKREEIQKHQREKRRRYKERRAQRQEMKITEDLKAERAEMVNIIADAINKAKGERKLLKRFKTNS